MKKITLSFVALAMSAISFAALNPFAYGLKSELSVDKSELKFLIHSTQRLLV